MNNRRSPAPAQQASAELSASRYRRATVAGRVGVWEWNLATSEISLDPILKEILGYEDHEIRNHLDHWGSLVHPDDAEKVSAAANAHIAGDTPVFQVEHRMLHRDGSIRWFLARGQVTRDADGRATAMVGTDIDVTEQKRQSAELSQAQEVNKRIVDNIEDCIKILDLDGRLIYINAAGLRLLELDDSASILNRSLADIYLGESGKSAAAALDAARQAESSRFIGQSHAPSGMRQWWDVIVTPIIGADGSVIQILAISRDITARRRDEEFRAVQHRMLEEIASGSALEEVFENLVRLIEQYSRGAVCSILRLDDDGRTIRHATAPSLPEEYVEAIDGLTIGPSVGSCGTAMFLRASVIVNDILEDPLWECARDVASRFGLRSCWSTPIFSGDGKVFGSLAIYAKEARKPKRDELQILGSAASFAHIAVDQHQAQKALRESESRNRAILQAIPDWMFLTSADGTFLDYHAKDPSALHLAPSEFLGRNIRDVMPAPLGERFARTFRRALEANRREKVEYSLPSADAERFFEATVVRCNSDKVLSIVRDVTSQKNVELEVATQRRELAHLGRVAVLGELTGALAHELSQPLTATRLDAATARQALDIDAPDLDDVREMLDDIIESTERASVVIDQLRALLRKEDIRLTPVDLNEIARQVIGLARTEIASRRVRLRETLNARHSALMGDGIQLQQVILNLILNACDATGQLPESNRLIVIETESDGEFVRLRVSDSGVGIPADRLERIFEPFVTFSDKGLGLGLSICRSIVRAHQGTIHAENNGESGATFTCRFPLLTAGKTSRPSRNATKLSRDAMERLSAQ